MVAAPHQASSGELELYRASILVTGSHYSITTLLGELLAQSARFHLLFEPINPNPSSSYRTIAVDPAYPLYEGDDYARLRAGLCEMITGRGLPRAVFDRLSAAQNLLDLARIARLLQRELPLRLARRPAVIKAPFLAFTARTMQQADGLSVILGVRHPCAFVESVMRRNDGYDFKGLAQPSLYEALPEFADPIARFAAARQPALEEGLLLWRVIQTFHARYLLVDPRTLLVRQEDAVADFAGMAARVFAFANVPVPRGSRKFAQRIVSGNGADAAQGADYLTRNPQATLAKWRSRMSPASQHRIRDAAEKLALAFGYRAQDWDAPGVVTS